MEPSSSSAKPSLNAWLVRVTGPLDGTRHFIRGEVFRVGRDPTNDLVVDGAEAAIVSGLHMEIRREGSTHRLVDLSSTNGTFVDGQRVSEITLRPRSLITLGPNGPQFQFELDVVASQDLTQTLVVQEGPPVQASSAVGEVLV